MLSNLKYSIEKIHKSNLYGIFIEMGCGNPVAHELCNIEGASKTIFFAENPYSKEFSQAKYNFTGRAVSAETVCQILKNTSLDFSHPNINLYYVSSFQIGNLNDKSTHGYIGIYNKPNPIKIYHVSIHESHERFRYIELISKIGIDLLYNLKYDHNEISCIDHQYDVSENFTIYSNFRNSLLHLINSQNIAFIYIKNGQIYRLEDYLRTDNANLIIYKGSFNPFHIGHSAIIEKSLSVFPNSEVCVSISTNTFGKGSIDINDLIWRIEILTKLGYPILICNSGLFESMANIIYQKSGKKPIFPIGHDTFTRIRNIAGIPAQFLVMDRDNKIDNIAPWENCLFIKMDLPVSSTEIRNNSSNLDYLKNKLHPSIIDDVITKFGR